MAATPSCKPGRLLDNIVIYTSPKGDVPEMFFIAGIVEDDGHGVANLKSVLPPMWKGKYQGHFFKFDKTLAMGPEAAAAGVTHLALLEGPIGGEGFDHFYAGDTIRNCGVVLNYNANMNEYRFIHCRSCAVEVLKWMQEMQEPWSKEPTPAALAA